LDEETKERLVRLEERQRVIQSDVLDLRRTVSMVDEKVDKLVVDVAILSKSAKASSSDITRKGAALIAAVISSITTIVVALIRALLGG